MKKLTWQHIFPKGCRRGRFTRKWGLISFLGSKVYKLISVGKGKLNQRDTHSRNVGQGFLECVSVKVRFLRRVLHVDYVQELKRMYSWIAGNETMSSSHFLGFGKAAYLKNLMRESSWAVGRCRASLVVSRTAASCNGTGTRGKIFRTCSSNWEQKTV